jgi:hypothetical protein
LREGFAKGRNSRINEPEAPDAVLRFLITSVSSNKNCRERTTSLYREGARDARKRKAKRFSVGCAFFPFSFRGLRK